MSMMSSFVSYNRQCARILEKQFPNFFYSPNYNDKLLELINECIEKNGKIRILEIGGIDRPLLNRSNTKYRYDGMDIKSDDRCYELYDKFIVQSVEDEIVEKYDLTISTTLLEHVRDNTASILNIYNSLNQNGATYHYIPSKYHPYSIATQLIGPKVQRFFIPILRPGTENVTGYLAYFDHCSIYSMKKVFEKCGFKRITIIPYYRAYDYFTFFLPFFLLVTTYENLCKLFRLKNLASGFIIGGIK